MSKISWMFLYGMVTLFSSAAIADEPFKFNVDYRVGDWPHQGAYGNGPLECAANLVSRVLSSEIKQSRFTSDDVYVFTEKNNAISDGRFENGISSYKFTANLAVNGSGYARVRGYIENLFFDNDPKHPKRLQSTFCSFGYFECPSTIIKPVSNEPPSSSQQRSKIFVYLASETTDEHPIVKGTIYPRSCF